MYSVYDFVMIIIIARLLIKIIIGLEERHGDKSYS